MQVLRTVAHTHANSDPSKYSFDDWEFIFYLLGERDEPPLLGKAESNWTRNDDNVASTSRIDSWKGENGLLDWLDENSPFNVAESVREWILLMLVEVLERECCKLRNNRTKVNSLGDSTFT